MLQQGRKPQRTDRSGASYPAVSMGLSLFLIYLSPFVSLALNYIAFGILMYRVIRYDETVFGVDYCVLAGVSYIFLSTGRVSLLAWLSIAAAAWYIIRNGLAINAGVVAFLMLFDFMLLRMQTAFNTFVLCFSQVLLLYVLLSFQDLGRIPLSAKAFCGNVIISSVYAYIFRYHPAIRSLLGREVLAYWGGSQYRFQGLLRDPNYYMTLVVISMALLVYLFLNRHISAKYCCICEGFLLFFGSITYSKTFVVVLIVSVVLLVAMMSYKKMYLLAAAALGATMTLAVVLSKTVLAVTVYRFTSASNLYDLTTGRSQLLFEYFARITSSAKVLFFGSGLAAKILKRGTHNIFLEIVFFFGLVGLLLMIVYVISMIHLVQRKSGYNPNGPFRYAVLLIFLALFCTLQGLIFSITYVMLYLSILATAITPDEKQGEVV